MIKNQNNQMRFIFGVLLFLLFIALHGPVQADALDQVLEGFDATESDTTDHRDTLGDVLEGFEAPEDRVFSDEADSSSQSPVHLSGAAGLAGAVNLVSHQRPKGSENRQGLAKLRGELDLTCDLTLGRTWRARATGTAFYDAAFRLNGRDNYTEQTLDQYEHEAELGETWLQGSPLSGLDIRVGRQIVVWGKSDNIRVTDILNPMDKREPGMTDIEDLRLPVTMTRLDYSLGQWVVTGIAVHEIRFDKWPVFGSDYYTSDTILPEEETQKSSFDNQELGLSIAGTFSSWETAFYWARLFDDTSHMELVSDGTCKRLHARITMLGTAVSLARGNWLYKAEAALLDGLKFAALPGQDKTRLDVLAGIDYSGFTNTTITLEAANRHLFGFQDSMAQSPDYAREDEFQWAFRISRNFLHDRLETVLLVQSYEPLGQGGALERLMCTYDLTDHWEATMGVVLYQSGDKPAFKDLNECNRLFFSVHYSF